MSEIIVAGLDLATHVFQVHGAGASGRAFRRKQLSRKQVLAFMHTQPRCKIAIETCAAAHHWAQTLAHPGHDWSARPSAGQIGQAGIDRGRALQGRKAMPRRHRSHSAEFKRQVVVEYDAGETLDALSRHDDM